MENNFDALLKATVDHLIDKRYLYKPEIKEKYEDGTVKLDNNGNEKFVKTTPTPHKNVMLTIAFNMALKNYTNIRSTYKIKELKLSEITDMLLRFFSNKFIDKIGDALLISTKQNYQYEAIDRFRKIEYKLFGTLDRFRNYHSHYVHEHGILTFKNLFLNGELLTTEDFEEAKNWFQKKFDMAKDHLINSLATKRLSLMEELSIVDPNDIDKMDEHKMSDADKKLKISINEINSTIINLQGTYFLDKSKSAVTLNGQLFIASMFLYKRQMKTVLEKWRDFRLDKELTGYGNSIHTFFTYYCLSESYSLNNFNNDLMKFRNITSKLTTIPFSSNTQLEPIYEKIRAINKENYHNLEILKVYKAIENEIEKLELKLNTATGSYNQHDIRNIQKCRQKLTNYENDHNQIINIYKEQREAKKMFIKYSEEINSVVDSKAKKLLEKEIQKDKMAFENLDFQNKIMPIRRRNILTDVLLQYLLDNHLFGENIKIAIAKTSVDRLEYYNLHKSDGLNEKESLEELKNRIKTESKPEIKSTLREHYKELKRNFFFKTPAELELLSNPHAYKVPDNAGEESEITMVKGFKFANKEKNALLQFNYSTNNQKELTINISVSPQLLMKWVFIHLSRKDNEGLKAIESFVKMYINKLAHIKDIDSKDLIGYYLKSRNVNYGTELTPGFIESFNKKGHNLNKVFPRSIMQSAGFRERKIDIVHSLNDRIDRFEKFENNNRHQPKPWTYESKKKIDVILEYLHFKLLEDVYVNKINEEVKEDAETFLRHNYFSINSYDIVRQYFRYFGRYENRTYDELKVYGTDKFVEPQLIERVKQEYAALFAYIENQISKNFSLENLFEAVIIRYIDDLKSILINREQYADETLYKVLKIDTGSVAADVNKNLSTHYLKTIALSDEIISVKNTCSTELKSIIETKAKNGKPQYYTDYSFLRSWLQAKDDVTTNTDYILKHIIDQDIEFKKNDRGKLIPNSVFKKLLKFKTEELMLWQIAKTYWFKANGAEYALDDYMKNSKSSNYQVFTTFNKVYKRDLDYVIKIEPKFWNNAGKTAKFSKVIEANPEIVNKTLEIKLKVPAKRYDNQFLGTETKLITEYCLWNHCRNNEIVLPAIHTYYNGNNQAKTLNLQVYDQLIKMIHIELEKSLGFIGALLVAEKKLVDHPRFKTSDYLLQKYKDKAAITDFYLTIADKDLKSDYNKAIFESFVNYTNIDFQDKPEIADYLVLFRNFALHYQLQDPIRSKVVNKLLKTVNGKIEERDYHKKE